MTAHQSRFAAIVLLHGLVMLAAPQTVPKVGYMLPAGANRGSRVRIVIGGQCLSGPTGVYVSGSGVRGKIVEYVRPPRNLNNEQRWLVVDAMMKGWLAEFERQGLSAEAVEERRQLMLKRQPWAHLKKTDVDLTGQKMPGHPLLADLRNKSAAELMHAEKVLFFPRNKLQLNRQLDEMVTIAIEIDGDAEPGNRELRLRTRQGLSNPMVFQVGTMSEVAESEPNDRSANPRFGKSEFEDLMAPRVLAPPVVVNGAIMPGDVDRFRFRTTKGQRITIKAAARELIPFLADAVPGWFQAVVAVYDADGSEIAYADDYRVSPDPFLSFEAPRTGEYEVEIRDAIYRGREDFVYRLTIGSGSSNEAQPTSLRRLPAVPRFRHLRRCVEKEPNHFGRTANLLAGPSVVSGTINVPGDVDLYRLKGRVGDRVVIEVQARQLGSPMDSLVRLLDRTGKVLAWNDDYVLKDGHLHLDRVGLNTHHADSYLAITLPNSGDYYVQITDAQRHGGPDYKYYCRIALATPDFELRVTPSSLFAAPGAIVPVSVHLLRYDGFDGDVEIRPAEPGLFTMTGDSVVAAGRNQASMTVRMPEKGAADPIPLKLVGIAKTRKGEILRPAVPADIVMQAFLWRHLVPAEAMSCVVKQQKSAMPAIELTRTQPIRLVRGGLTKVKLATKAIKDPESVVLEIHEGPEGVSIDGGIEATKDGVAFELALSADSKCSVFSGNVIVQAFRQRTPKAAKGKAKAQRWPIGYLPAIPVEIVKR